MKITCDAHIAMQGIVRIRWEAAHSFKSIPEGQRLVSCLRVPVLRGEMPGCAWQEPFRLPRPLEGPDFAPLSSSGKA